MKPLHTFTGALALSAALLGAPSPALAQVSDTTRAKVEKLMAEDPAFAKKMEKRYFKGCLDGSNTDALCEKNVSGWYDLYLSEKALAAKEQALTAKEQAVAAKEQANAVGDNVLGLIQLGQYVAAGILPEPKHDRIGQIATNPTSSAEIKEFVTRVRANPRISRTDRERLIGYIKTTLVSYNDLVSKAGTSPSGNEELKKEAKDFESLYASLAQSLAKM